MNSQDIENLDDLANEDDAEEEKPESPKVEVKFTTPKGKNGKKTAEDEIASALRHLLGGEAGGIMVQRLGPENWGQRRVKTGELRRRMTLDEYESGAWHDIYGGGTYRIGRGKFWFETKIPGPPKEFEEPEPNEPRWFYLPNGQPFLLQPGQPTPPGATATAPPVTMPWSSGWGQQQNVAAEVAKAVAETLKPILDILSKRDEKSASSALVEVERLKLDQAKEERKAREVEAQRAKEIEETKLEKAHAAELKRIEMQAKVQEEIAKAQAEAAKAQIEAAKEAAKAKADESTSLFDRLMTIQQGMKEDMKEQMAALMPEKPEESDFLKFERMLSLAHKIQNRTGEKSMAELVIENLPKTLEALRAPQPPNGAPAPQQLPGPQQQGQQPPHPYLTAQEFLSALYTAHDAMLQGRAVQEVLPVLKQRTPNMIAACRTTDPMGLIPQIEQVAADPALPAADKERLAAFKALAIGQGLPWLEEFFKQVKA